MEKSLKAFMNGILDYAGLFPPAALSLDEAIQNYGQYRAGSERWMLSRFIIPASRLEELEPYRDLFSQDQPYEFSVLGKDTETIADYEAALAEVVDDCSNFASTHKGAVNTGMLEMKLPSEVSLSHDVNELARLMDYTAGELVQSAVTPNVIFYEGLFDEGWKKDITAILEAVSKHNRNLDTAFANYQYAAFKLRCGGTEPEHFPSVEQVTFVLDQARTHNVALKGTAGLHHPVRHYADSVQSKMHGFFNVFGGAMLAYANDLKPDELQEIIGEEDPEQFSFSDDAFHWREYAVSTREIEELRRVALLSYGSCSFDEPREDLEQMGLM